MSKSKIIGIAVNEEKVEQVAHRIGCGILKVPFTYLGSKVGGCMSRIQAWNEIVDNMSSRLSKWKMKTLSIGGRLTLLKSVLRSMPIYHMSIFKVPLCVLHRMESIRCRFFNGADLDSKKAVWVKWNKVLSSKEKSGLDVSSLYALNRALLFKWVWRFTTQKSSLWARVITAIHGVDGKISHRSNSGHKSIWRDIVRDMEVVKNQGADLFSFMQKKLGNGADTCFWEDTWRGVMPFKQRYPRLYGLELDKNINVAAKLAQTSLVSSFRREPRSGMEASQLVDLLAQMEEVVLGDMTDRWYWSLEGSGVFSVASVRKLIDDIRLPEVSSQTRWIKAVPIKVNVLAWKVRLDGLPSRLNISRRGMNITSILCPICDREVESVSHVFFACHVAKDNF
ncbi:RNA-directed DNA polymerase, eukaryota, reverse transcriptase zinc-binding domain protein [Tanacetum coccineum]